ncbi:LANO_0A01772g1_1 [Lachancea nothofagi CBS 11611]|uniref:LANO_0A01772g1_1 n=1 Tax=Lachancea nothofagi CBS 11611 TaxID=1266666 RepID=A0A1G4INF9_9SACH|nr:LANO_0A01772g1_1 [Lachancea nothofagi CBS 11611]
MKSCSKGKRWALVVVTWAAAAAAAAAADSAGSSALAPRDMLMTDGGGADNGSAHVMPPRPVPHEPMHMHDVPILETQLTANERLYWENYSTATFFNLPSGHMRARMQLHVALVGLVTCVGYPAALVLGHVAWSHHAQRSSSASARMAAPHLLLTLVDTLLLLIAMLALANFHYDPLTYPGNAYRKTCVIVAVLSIVHLAATAVRYAVHRKNQRTKNPALSGFSTPPPESELYEMVAASSDRHFSQSSHDSELTAAASVGSPGVAPHNKTSARQGSPLETERTDSDLEAHRRSLTSFNHDQPLVFRAVSTVLQFTSWPLFIILAVHCVIGIAVGNLFGEGIRVFNILAHWIKGGVFVTLGIVSLARYCGCGASNGWAWNKHTTQAHPSNALQNWRRLILPYGSVITVEFIESFLIFFYGSTNVFLEHLSNEDGHWHAKDLQHVSIAFMYIGCGLCGLITEYKLSEWRNQHSVNDRIPHSLMIGTPGFSPNPFPAFTIFWTGILMSQHAQASATSTAIHVQWGYLLSYGSFFRLFTFLLLIWKPNKDEKPARPFTELIVSFCLLCGGLIFMESTDQVVEALEYRGLTSMFTFNLSVGFTTLFMAWEMILLLWKDWLQKR